MIIQKNTATLTALILSLLITTVSHAATHHLTDIRTATQDPFQLRITLTLDTPSPDYDTFTLDNPHRIVIDLHDTTTPLTDHTEDINTGGILTLRTGIPATDTTRIVIDTAAPLQYNIATPTPATLIITITKILEPGRWLWHVRTGIDYSVIITPTPDGTAVTHITEINPRLSQLTPRIAIAGTTPGDRAPLTSIAATHNAYIAINAGYFDMKSGIPLDILIHRGHLLSLPDRYRGFLGIRRDGTLLITRATARMYIHTPAGDTQPIHCINRTSPSCHLTLFTPDFGATTPSTSRTETPVLNNHPLYTSTSPTEIPPHGYTLSADTHSADILTSLDHSGALIIDTVTIPDLTDIEYGITAGPALILDGKPQYAINEDFAPDSDITTRRQPRSAIATRPDGTIILAVTEGRVPRSAGLHLSELTDLLTTLGATNALNLDGGGSSQLIIGSHTFPGIPGTPQRPIPNAILFIQYLDPTGWDPAIINY